MKARRDRLGFEFEDWWEFQGVGSYFMTPMIPRKILKENMLEGWKEGKTETVLGLSLEDELLNWSKRLASRYHLINHQGRREDFTVGGGQIQNLPSEKKSHFRYPYSSLLSFFTLPVGAVWRRLDLLGKDRLVPPKVRSAPPPPTLPFGFFHLKNWVNLQFMLYIYININKLTKK